MLNVFLTSLSIFSLKRKMKRRIFDDETPKVVNATPPVVIFATETRNFAIDDPIIDYYKLYNKGGAKSRSDFLNFIFSKGIQFEEDISQLLEVKHNMIKIIPGKYNPHNKEKYLNETLAAMKKKVPIIYQGFVSYTEFNKEICGIPDFLILGEYLPKIFTSFNKIILPIEVNPKLYYVVDCKWSSVCLRIDGSIMTNQTMNANKCQLAIYTNCLNKMQNSNITLAFIIAKSISTRDRKFKYGPLEVPGVVDYSRKDKNFITVATEAIQWIYDLKTDGMNWKLPTPSTLQTTRPELFPNMKNSNDEPYHQLKKTLADEIGEITSIWNCGIRNRRNAFMKNVYTWRDNACTASLLGFSNGKLKPLINNVLSVNRSNDIIHPLSFQRRPSWMTMTPKDCFLDFEFLYNFNDKFPYDSEEEILYMIETTRNGK